MVYSLFLLFFLTNYSYACKDAFERVEEIHEEAGSKYKRGYWILNRDVWVWGYKFEKGTSFNEIHAFFNKKIDKKEEE